MNMHINISEKTSAKRTEHCRDGCNVFRERDNLQAMVRRLDAIIDSSFDGLWICDGEGRVVRINKGSEKINSLRADKVIGKKMQDLVSEGLIDRSVTLDVIQNRATVTTIQQLSNGKQILVTGTPLFNDDGATEFVVVNERDITNLNEMRNQLEVARAFALGYRQELSELEFQEEFLSEIVLKSKIMQQVFDKSCKVASADSTVILQGESGVGKGFLAKIIHRASPRKDNPFIRVDCGAIPETLIESELFGYERGAFTGARADGKLGQIELSEAGTLFLDEIGDLPLNIQVKLLRFFEEGEIIPVGGTKPKQINTRIICATHRNLNEMVRNGEFRQDLFFRLSVIPIYIPPLRQRREDIPAFIHFFVNKFNEKYSLPKEMVSQAVDCLCRYSFPGNIRELANLIERLVVLSPNDRIYLEDVPSFVRFDESGLERLFEDKPLEGLGLQEALCRFEKNMVLRALRSCRTQREAAGLLGVDQSTIARKARKYDLRTDAILHNQA